MVILIMYYHLYISISNCGFRFFFVFRLMGSSDVDECASLNLDDAFTDHSLSPDTELHQDELVEVFLLLV